MADRASFGFGFSSQPSPRTGITATQRGLGTVRRRKGIAKAPKHSIAEPGLGASVDQQVRLYQDSAGVENLASDPFVVEQATHAVMSALKDVFNVMEFLRNKWLVLYRLYRGETLVQYSYGRNQLHSPEPFKIVETLHPRIMREVFGSQRWFRIIGDDVTWDENARAQEHLTQDQLRASRYRRKAAALVRNGLFYGNAPQKTWWKQEIGTRRMRTARRVPDPDVPGATIVELLEESRKELLFDGNTTEVISPFDFFGPPNASSIEEAEWCGDRSGWPDFKVKQMGEMGFWKNLSRLKDHPGSKDTTFGDEFKERKSYSYGVFDPREAGSAPHIPHYQVIDWWGPLLVRADGGSYEVRQCNVVMIEPDSLKLIVRVTENPFWHGMKPYQMWRPIAIDDELFGIGALEMIARQSFELDLKLNLYLAATQLQANPVYVVSDEANIPDGQFVIEPGTTYRVPGDPSKAIMQLPMQPVGDTALKAINQLRIDIRETAGTSSPQMGTSDPFGSGGGTATEYTGNLQQSDIRLSGLVESFDEDITTPMIQQMVMNNQQFMSWEKMVRKIGADGVRFRDQFLVRPEDLVGNFLVQPLAGLLLKQRQTQVQPLISILDRAQVINQTYGPGTIKVPKLLAKILQDGFDIRNVDDFIEFSGASDEVTLLSAMQEHELWFHGSVPPVRDGDNHYRHWIAHNDVISSERFEELEERSPQTAGLARAHVAQHAMELAMLFERQEKQMMEQAQAAAMQGMGAETPGTAGGDEEAESPKFRKDEAGEEGEGSDGGDGEGEGPRADAGRAAPNTGSMMPRAQAV